MPFNPPRPRPATISLVNSAATATVDGDTRWEDGIRFQPDGCGAAEVQDPCAFDAATPLDRPALVEIEPFLVVAEDRCSTFGWSQEDYEGRARRTLRLCESKQIAHEFWTGDLAQAAGWDDNQYLANAGADEVGDGESPVAALACLEGALAACGCGQRGMIHVTPQLATVWYGESLIRREGNLLLTALDTIVVSDAGYDGSSPAGAAATTTQWAYATGLVFVQRGPISIVPPDFRQAVDHATNDVAMYANRPAAVGWDGCCHLTIEVDLAVCALDVNP